LNYPEFPEGCLGDDFSLDIDLEALLTALGREYQKLCHAVANLQFFFVMPPQLLP
jgi:hypothetical protein